MEQDTKYTTGLIKMKKGLLSGYVPLCQVFSTCTAN